MICKMCGSNNLEGARFCSFCGCPIQESFSTNNDQNWNVQPNYNFSGNMQNPQMWQNANMGQGFNVVFQPIKTYMTHSIISLIISLLMGCCLGIFVVIPIGLGITAVVYACKTSNFLKSGSIEEAKRTSKLAKYFYIGAIISSVGFLLISFLYSVFKILAEIGSFFNQFTDPQNADEFENILDQIGNLLNQFADPETADDFKKTLDEIMKQAEQQNKM